MEETPTYRTKTYHRKILSVYVDDETRGTLDTCAAKWRCNRSVAFRRIVQEWEESCQPSPSPSEQPTASA